MKLGILITIVTAVWYVIQAITQAKEREAQRKTEAARLAQRKAGGPAQAGGNPQIGGNPQASGGGGGSHARSELAERRRAQLEELRNKRAGRTTTRVGSPPSAPSGAPGPAASGRASASRFNMGIAPVAQPRQSAPAPKPVSRQRTAPQTQSSRRTAGGSGTQKSTKRADALRSRPTSRSQSQTTPPRLNKPTPTAKSKGKRRTTESIQGSSPITAGPRKRASGAGLHGVRLNRASLRHAVILKELLDRPVSLRDTG